MKNFIGLNIKHLCEKNFLKQDEFGLFFGLNKGVIGTYVRENASPKIEIIQRICANYEISIDDFVNTDLSKAKNYNQGNKPEAVNEPMEGYGYVSLKYMELLEKSIEDKDKIIKSLESKMDPDKSKTA
jgi:HTH-type transcriptional regulator/antitoxin PezA